MRGIARYGESAHRVGTRDGEIGPLQCGQARAYGMCYWLAAVHGGSLLLFCIFFSIREHGHSTVRCFSSFVGCMITSLHCTPNASTPLHTPLLRAPHLHLLHYGSTAWPVGAQRHHGICSCVGSLRGIGFAHAAICNTANTVGHLCRWSGWRQRGHERRLTESNHVGRACCAQAHRSWRDEIEPVRCLSSPCMCPM